MARHISAPQTRGFSGERHPREVYPWADWIDGMWWEADKGVDFTCGLNSFRAALHYAAKSRGYTVETVRTSDETLAFKFTM